MTKEIVSCVYAYFILIMFIATLILLFTLKDPNLREIANAANGFCLALLKFVYESLFKNFAN